MQNISLLKFQWIHQHSYTYIIMYYIKTITYVYALLYHDVNRTNLIKLSQK